MHIKVVAAIIIKDNKILIGEGLPLNHYLDGGNHQKNQF